MISTLVGYTGGTADNPTYRHIGDHIEAIRIEFDPRQVTYVDLLDIFWQSHDPTYDVFVRQYTNAIFTMTNAQMEQAQKSLEDIADVIHSKITTYIEPAGIFHPAEDYHQKYLLKEADGLYRELKTIYPDEKDFAASTATAKLNGYLGCNGNPEILAAEMSELGLSPPMQQRLLTYVTTSCEGFSGLSCPVPE